MKISKTQLSLDFTKKPYSDSRKQNLGSVRNSENYIFHKEASIILKDSFTLKLNYEGRSFLIKGNYKIINFKNYSDNSNIGSKIININIGSILSFRSFFYSKYFMAKKEELKFTKIISDILGNVYHNPNLEINEKVKF